VRTLLAGGAIAAALLILALPSGAAPDRAVTLQRVDVTRLPAIDVCLTVTDGDGIPVRGLTARDVSVSIDGTPQRIDSMATAVSRGATLAVALLFDRSGSVKAAQEAIKDAAVEFLRTLGPDDQLAVISFDDKVSIDGPLSTDRAALEAAVRGISIGRNTALYDALQAALGVLKGARARRHAIVVLSDGKDTSSTAKAADVLAAAQKQGVPVFTIAINDAVDAGVLGRIAHDTGGDALAASKPDEVRRLYQTIGSRLVNQYLLTITSTFGEDGAWRRLSVSVPGGTTAAPAAAERQFIATTGLGVSREVISAAEQRAEQQGWAIGAAIGAGAGMAAGLLLVLLVRVARPRAALRPLLVVAVVVLTGLVGGIVAVVVGTLGS